MALAARGHRVITVTPRYAFYSDVPSTNVRVPLELPRDAQRDLGKGASHATLYARVQGGVARVFVGHPVFRAQEHRDSHAVYGAGYSDAGDGLDLMYSVLCQVGCLSSTRALHCDPGSCSRRCTPVRVFPHHPRLRCARRRHWPRRPSWSPVRGRPCALTRPLRPRASPWLALAGSGWCSC